MTLFIDNDALLKLAQYDLLDAALTLFSVQPKDVRVLATAKYALLPAKERLRRCIDEESADRLEDFLVKAAKLNPQGIDSEILDALAAQPGIDPGEALLLAMAASDCEARVITGDKRALAALRSGEKLEGVQTALSGRVITLELLLLFLVDNDFARAQACVRNRPCVDKALTNAFGVSAPASLDSVREALHSYVEHLRRVTGELLYPSPASS